MAPKLTISKSVQLLLLVSLLTTGLYFGRAFLIPIAFAGILSMLLLPLSKRLEGKGLGRGVAACICLLIFLLAIAGILALLTWQVSDLAKDFSQMEQKLTSALEQFKAFINAKVGISESQQTKIIKEQQKSGEGAAQQMVSGFLGVLVDIILVLVYTFLFIFFRGHLKAFLLKITPVEDHTKTNKIVADSSKVAHKYLTGMFTMIVMLWVLYGVGFSIAGVPNAIFFAILCGILEIVPFVGNLTGSTITFLVALTQGGGAMAIGVVITYGLVQFIQTYIIEPVIVGGEVNINPLFTILVLIVGEQIWGIAGMILAVPLLGITKIVFDNVEGLKPYGFLIGTEKKKKKSGFTDRIKSLFNKKK